MKKIFFSGFLFTAFFFFGNFLIADCNTASGLNFKERSFCRAYKSGFCTSILLDNGNSQDEFYFKLCSGLAEKDCQKYFPDEASKGQLICNGLVTKDCGKIPLFTMKDSQPNILDVSEEYSVCSGILENNCNAKLLKFPAWKSLCDELGMIFRKPDDFEDEKPNKKVAAVKPDTDSDGIPDITDNCKTISNLDQFDLDGDHSGDVCDEDVDGDGFKNDRDNCPRIPNPEQESTLQYGVGDKCLDSDYDGVFDTVDNCPSAYNPLQADKDYDKKGDACDDDIDGDKVVNEKDNCPYISNSNGTDTNDNFITGTDTDADGKGDDCDYVKPAIESHASVPYSKNWSFEIKKEMTLQLIYKCGDNGEKCNHPDTWKYVWRIKKAPAAWAIKMGQNVAAWDKGSLDLAIDSEKQVVSDKFEFKYTYEYLGKYEIEPCVYVMVNENVDSIECLSKTITVGAGDKKGGCGILTLNSAKGLTGLYPVLSFALILGLLLFRRKLKF